MADPAAAQAAAPEGARVLIVDDRESNRTLIQEILDEAGYEVLVASGGEGAIACFKARPPDLALVDIRMGGMDGFETLRALRALPGGPAVPVVLLTAADDSATHERALTSGAEDFLPQPVRRTELLMRVRSLVALRRARIVGERMHQQREEIFALLVHDLRSPLAAITMGAGAAAKVDGLPERARRTLDRIGTAAETMGRMLSDILDVQVAERSALTVAPRLVDIADVCESVVALMGPRLENARQRLVIDVQQDSPPKLRTDPELVRRILTNLVENAVTYSPAGSAVALRVTVSGEPLLLALSVRDAGRGIPAADREKIFEKYVRVAGDSHPRSSRGLGLAFCRLAAEALGGRIWVEDNEPTGAAFCLELPSLPGPTGHP